MLIQQNFYFFSIPYYLIRSLRITSQCSHLGFLKNRTEKLKIQNFRSMHRFFININYKINIYTYIKYTHINIFIKHF